MLFDGLGVTTKTSPTNKTRLTPHFNPQGDPLFDAIGAYHLLCAEGKAGKADCTTFPPIEGFLFVEVHCHIGLHDLGSDENYGIYVIAALSPALPLKSETALLLTFSYNRRLASAAEVMLSISIFQHNLAMEPF